MSEMIERVARALCAADELDWDAQANGQTSGSGSDDEQQGYLDKARAAIEAMREPTEAMTAKAWSMITSNLRYEEVYRHLIDAALNPKRED